MINGIIFLILLLGIFLSTRISPTTILGRFTSLVAVLLGATMIVSGSLLLVPGDPVDYILGDQALEASRELLARDLGLIDEYGNKVGYIDQYLNFLSSLTKNELKSFITRRSALETVSSRLPYTFFLALSAMLVAIIIGPMLGVFAAFFRHRWPDHTLTLLALIGISVPSFFLGPLLLLLFSIKLNWLPISGADDGIRSVVLPALSMGTALAAMLARMSRASMLEILGEDFIRTARSKGLSNFVVFFKHALRNALIPVVTLMGMQFGAVLSGAVVTEKIFNWPGIGLLLLESIQQLDMPMVQTCVLLIAFLYALINMITDLIYGLIDPRISMGKN